MLTQTVVIGLLVLTVQSLNAYCHIAEKKQRNPSNIYTNLHQHFRNRLSKFSIMVNCISSCSIGQYYSSILLDYRYER